jgi:exo-1,4-beta-D-glucosaminidase
MSAASRCLTTILIFTLLGSATAATTRSTTYHPLSWTSSWSELSDGWRIVSADQVSGDDASVSLPSFDVSQWHAVHHMPATVLQALEDDGVYKDLYFGMNLTTPGDLWKKDWWYRTTFTAPAGHEVYSLIFKGINYRADIWVNGKKVADKTQVVGMYNSFEFDVSKMVHAGGDNILTLTWKRICHCQKPIRLR